MGDLRNKINRLRQEKEPVIEDLNDAVDDNDIDDQESLSLSLSSVDSISNRQPNPMEDQNSYRSPNHNQGLSHERRRSPVPRKKSKLQSPEKNLSPDPNRSSRKKSKKSKKEGRKSSNSSIRKSPSREPQ